MVKGEKMDFQTNFFSLREIEAGNNRQLFDGFARLRHEEFVVRRQWDLKSRFGYERDPYDNPWAWYLVVKYRDQVVSGMRFVPSVANNAGYSYMIRDAQKEIIALPSTLLYRTAPQSVRVWEGTRTCLSHSLSFSQRRKVWILLAEGIKAIKGFCYAEKVLTFTPASWPRWYPVVGLDAKAIGPVLEVAGVEAQCVEIDLGASCKARS